MLTEIKYEVKKEHHRNFLANMSHCHETLKLTPRYTRCMLRGTFHKMYCPQQPDIMAHKWHESRGHAAQYIVLFTQCWQ